MKKSKFRESQILKILKEALWIEVDTSLYSWYKKWEVDKFDLPP